MIRRVLIVDDDPMVLSVLKNLFECFQHGHRYAVETARDGAGALMSLMCHQFDLVLLDMYMPGVSGLDLLKQMYSLGVRAPVLMITGNQDSKAAADALRGGVFAYVPKPVDLLRLDHLVALALGSSDHPSPPTQAAANPALA